MSGNDEKLPVLNELTKRKFLVSEKNMGLCLYIPKKVVKKESHMWDHIEKNTLTMTCKCMSAKYISVCRLLLILNAVCVL